MKLLETGPSPRGWHRLQVMLECPQKYAYTYETEGGREKTNSPALIKGSLMHLALAHHYMRLKNKQNGTDPDEWLEPKKAVEVMALKEGEEWEEHVTTVQECYDAYVAYWIRDAFKVLEVEELAYAKIGDTILTGRFDLVFEDSRGGVWICDHKTTTRLHANQQKFYSMSGQLIGYAYIGKKIFGERFKGIILNQVQHKAPCKFKRIELPPAPNIMKRFPSIVTHAEGLISSYKEQYKPNEYPMAANELTCFTRYGACPFLERCKWGR
jgi:hypothetical protein